MPLHQRQELAFDEDALAVVGIDVGSSRLTVQLQHDVTLLHALEHRTAAFERGHAGERLGDAMLVTYTGAGDVLSPNDVKGVVGMVLLVLAGFIFWKAFKR